ncbi:MAG: UDP-N-acetylmuramoyl-tripeptide--D-alanyl-D-alanine ligase [Clostridia bacterium]|nr:UDP-N-acetylmuramoyl-tripeptide--D-alanyl-D-alanine ligase [Clostridia bacterium]
MLFYVFLTLAIIAAAYEIYLTAVSNMHMLQLNTYRNTEQAAWMKNKPGKYLPNCLLALYGLTFVFFGNSVLYALAILFSLLLIPVNKYYSKPKKKFVVTARVKRMFVTEGVLTALIVAGGVVICVFCPQKYVFLLLVESLAFYPMLTMLSNLINRPLEKSINRWYVNDAKRMLAEASGLEVIGITGSYGKTSVKFYLNTIMSAFYDVLVTPESFNTPMGVVKTIRTSLKKTDRYFLCEMGARHVGDIKELTDIVHPRHGVITSIGEQHLETFHTVENIIHTKFELADALPPDGLLFLNGDSENIRNNLPDRQFVTYGIGAGNDYYASDVVVTERGTEFTVNVASTGESVRFSTKLLGEAGVINVTGAIAVANNFGIPLDKMKLPVRRIEPVPHRLQLINRGAVTIIDDAYNSNPAGCRAALNALAMCGGHKILLTPGMVELGIEQDRLNKAFGSQAAGVCDHIILVGEKQTRPIAEGALEAGFDEKKLFIASNLTEAMNFAMAVKTDARKFILLENDLPDNY